MTMRLAMIGLGKMGANMARRLCRKGIEVVGYDRDEATVAGLAAETSMVAATSVAEAVGKLTAPRVVWLMLPSGDPTDNELKELAAMLSPGDVVQLSTADGMRAVTVIKAGRHTADIDTNHPLAGKTLVFDIEVLDTRAATAEEVAHGHVHGAGGHHH